MELVSQSAMDSVAELVMLDSVGMNEAIVSHLEERENLLIEDGEYSEEDDDVIEDIVVFNGELPERYGLKSEAWMSFCQNFRSGAAYDKQIRGFLEWYFTR